MRVNICSTISILCWGLIIGTAMAESNVHSTASTSEANTLKNTPSNRIVAGDIMASETLNIFIKDLRTKQYQSFSTTELVELESGLQAIFNNIDNTEDSLWKKHGLSWTFFESGDVIVLHGNSDLRQGAGTLLIRTSQPVERLYQVPHQYHDKMTGGIALSLFSDKKIGALFINTMHRRYVDLAHTPNTLLTSITKAFLRVKPTGKVIQFHGYSQTLRKTTIGRKANLIVSPGMQWPQPTLIPVLACLKEVIDPASYLFPTEISELGGTTNQIGRTMRDLGSSQFCHIEMSADLRKRLKNDTKSRTDFINCLDGWKDVL